MNKSSAVLAAPDSNRNDHRRIELANKRLPIPEKGTRFGLWTFTGRVQVEGGRRYELVCDCGSVAWKPLGGFLAGQTKSCGCTQPRHGQSKTRLSRIWRGMHTRCSNPNCPEYHLYGGRGIIICPEWRSSFEAFRDWALVNGYAPGLSIDRFPNKDGNYEPGNCRWATAKEQSNNSRWNRLIEFNGVSKPLTTWAEALGMSASLLHKRIETWGINEAFNRPVRVLRPRVPR